MAHGLPIMEQVEQWSNQDVIDWLNRMNLSDCTEVFSQRQIDGQALLNFSEDQLILLLNGLKLKQRLQLTKYINQCKEKDLTLKSAKKKILSIAQPKTPPPVPQVDYRWADDDDSEQSWGSDFDDDSDCETSDNQVPYNNSTTTAAQLNDRGINEKNNITDVNLPEQPQIPWRKLKTSETSEIKASNSIRTKPPVAAKPIIKPKPTLESINNATKVSQGMATSIPRPPSGLPTKFPRVIRPSEQPPPPPIKSQLPELENNSMEHTPFEEYEVPLSCSSSTSDTVSVISHASNNAYSSSTAGYGDGGSADESCSSFSSGSSDQPALPPRQSPQRQTAPPLPRKPPPKTPEVVRTLSEKPVLLPTRRSDDSNKGKEGQLKAITGVIKNKFTTLLLADKSNKGDSSSSLSGSRSSTPESSTHSVSLSNLCQEQLHSSNTLNRTRSQEPLGNRDAISNAKGHRSSLDEGVSMQNRPLPPLPVEDERRQSAPSVLPNEQLRQFLWFHAVERNAAEQILMELQQSGSYLVRQSKRAGDTNPYSLSVLFEGRVFHLNIRERSDDMFALGKEKPNEKAFDSVADLIQHHQTEPILLTTKGLVAGKTCLIKTPTKR